MKNNPNLIYKKTTINFDEELLVIKEELLYKDNEIKGESSEPIFEKTLKTNFSSIK